MIYMALFCGLHSKKRSVNRFVLSASMLHYHVAFLFY